MPHCEQKSDACDVRNVPNVRVVARTDHEQVPRLDASAGS